MHMIKGQQTFLGEGNSKSKVVRESCVPVCYSRGLCASISSTAKPISTIQNSSYTLGLYAAALRNQGCSGSLFECDAIIYYDQINLLIVGEKWQYLLG